MLNLQVQSVASYAATKNSRFSMTASQIRTIKQRWDETYNSLPTIQQQAVNNALSAAIAEFRRRNPNIKGTKILKSN